MYAINEIFYSLQGEGYFSGKPVIFIRFSGCNLNCSFCDTNHEIKETLTLIQILERIRNLNINCRHLVITGGEPLLQISQDFIDFFTHNLYFIQIETNGTIESKIKNYWGTVSPKSLNNWKIKEGAELKLVVTGQNKRRIEQYYKNSSFKNYYLQPCHPYTDKDISFILGYILRNPHWELSLQIQKILQIQ